MLAEYLNACTAGEGDRLISEPKLSPVLKIYHKGHPANNLNALASSKFKILESLPPQI